MSIPSKLALIFNLGILESMVRSPLLAIFLGIASAILFNLAFPGGPYPLLAWVSMLPIIFLLNSQPRFSCLGWASYGICFWFGAIHWLYVYLNFVLELQKWLSIILLFLCIFISAVPYIVTGYLVSYFHLFRGAWGPFKIAALLSSFVALWPVPFPGDLSMSFYHIPILTQIADIGGGPLVHFMIIWVNGLIVKGILDLIYKKQFPFYVWMNLLGIFFFIFTYGYLRLNQYENLYKKYIPNDFIKIGYVQPNLPGSDLTSLFGEYLSLNEKDNNFSTAIAFTDQLIEQEKKLDLIIWPETPIDIPYHQIEDIREAMNDFVKKSSGTPFAFVTMYPWSGLSENPFIDGRNTLYLVKDNEVSYPYHKIKLIPFSEYLPGENRFPFLRKIFPLVGQVTPGDKMDYIELGNKLKLIPLICYDGIFPNFVREFAIKGGNVFISLDNDTNFGPTKASEVHASVMYYRTIENRIPMIRLSNSGPSFTILSNGKFLSGSETAMYKKDFRAVTILPGNLNTTIYQHFGWCFPYAILIILLLSILFELRLSAFGIFLKIREKLF